MVVAVGNDNIRKFLGPSTSEIDEILLKLLVVATGVEVEKVD